jgi:hypothetical protein
LVGQGGLVDSSFNRAIIILCLADLVETIVAYVPDSHGFTLQLVDAALDQLPEDQHQALKNAGATTSTSGLLEVLTKLAARTTVSKGIGWIVDYLFCWLNQPLPPIS